MRISSPEAASSTTVSATSPAISACRNRCPPTPVKARLAIEERRSTFRATSAGSIPNKTLVSSETTRVKPITRPSSGTCDTGRKCSGNSVSSPRSATNPMPIPANPPTSASSRFSIQNCFCICHREAPSAIRVATSAVRRIIRTSVSPARFAHAISRISPAAAISAIASGRSFSACPFCSGTE